MTAYRDPATGRFMSRAEIEALQADHVNHQADIHPEFRDQLLIDVERRPIRPHLWARIIRWLGSW